MLLDQKKKKNALFPTLVIKNVACEILAHGNNFNK